MSVFKQYWLFILTLVIAVGIFVTNTNDTLFFMLNAQHTLVPTKVWLVYNWFCNPNNGILPLILLGITWFFRREKMLRVVLLLVSFYVVFYVLKISVQEIRPFIKYNPDNFFWLSSNPANDLIKASYSFPSGNVGNMSVFAFALFFLFGEKNIGLQIFLIGLVVFAMLARVCTGWHYPLDVLFAALIGYILTLSCMRRAFPYCELKQSSVQ